MWNKLDPSWLLIATTNGMISSLIPAVSMRTAFGSRMLTNTLRPSRSAPADSQVTS